MGRGARSAQAAVQADDFFAVAKHPKATFASTKISALEGEGGSHTMEGNLTLRGVTKGVSFPAAVPIDDKQATVKIEFKINRKDFGVSYAGMNDDLIRDHVVIELDFKVPRG